MCFSVKNHTVTNFKKFQKFNSITLAPQTQELVQYNVVKLNVNINYIYFNSTAYFFRPPFRKINSKCM